MAYLVPGTWETSVSANPQAPRGLLAAVGKRLAAEFGSDLEIVYPAYEASAFDNGKTYAESEVDGVAKVSALLERCPDSRTVLAGYSQGADVAGDVAWRIGHGQGPIPERSLISVGLLADPKRGDSPVIGPDVTGRGIAGDRPGGYGATSDSIFWLCSRTDLYCNVTNRNPILAKLGRLLGSPVKGDPADLAFLVSDASSVDLARARASVRRLVRIQHSGEFDAASVAELSHLARTVVSTFRPIVDSDGWLGQSVNESAAFDSGRGPDAAAVLRALSGMDTTGILEAASTTVSLSAQLSKTGDTLVARRVADAVARLAGLIAPLSEYDEQALVAASTSMGPLKSSYAVSQVLTVVQALTATDFARIGRDLRTLSNQLGRHDVHAAHATAQSLNRQLEPWVSMAANLDYETVSRLLMMIPDPTGEMQALAALLKLMGRIDIAGVANVAGRLQEVGWRAASGDARAAVQLPPIAHDFAELMSAALGSRWRTDSGQLYEAVGGRPAFTVASDLRSFIDVGDLGTVGAFAKDGFDAAIFLRSGAHTLSYSRPVFNGRSAVDEIYERFSSALAASPS